MNDESSLNQDSEECLEDIEDISNIAESFRNENYGFSKIE